MRSLEDHWKDLERLGFIRSIHDGAVRYEVPSRLGNGTVVFFGDLERMVVSVTDLEFSKPITLLEDVSEKTLSIGQFYEGAVDIYQTGTSEVLPCDHGLNAFVNTMQFSGLKKFSAGCRLVNTGFLFREKFFNEFSSQFGNTLPQDFWETAARILNPGVLFIPQITALCNQVKDCRLQGMALVVFMRAKCLEVFSLLFDYIYTNKTSPTVYLSASDIAALDAVRQTLEDEMLSPPSIKELSKRFGINQQKLMAGFKERYTMTVYSYVKRLRMEHALRLLQQENLLIGDIARLSGYKGEGHFQQVFFETFGILPLKARKNLLGH